MKESKKIKSTDIDKYLIESRGLERDYIGELLLSRKYAWYAASLFGLITIIALIAAIFGLKREAYPPTILRVDNATGAVDMLTHMKESDMSYGEVVDIYWLNKYVYNRQSYDFNNIQMLYDTTALLSIDEVQKEYYAMYQGENAIDKILGNHTRIIVNIKSITPHKSGGSAVVRFTTEKIDDNGLINSHKDLIATISYIYKNVLISSENRRINPLGFQVTSYRVDRELVNGGENN